MRSLKQVIDSMPAAQRAKVLARGREMKRIAELKRVCAELYQVIGSLADHADCFDHPDVQRALDNRPGWSTATCCRGRAGASNQPFRMRRRLPPSMNSKRVGAVFSTVRPTRFLKPFELRRGITVP